MKLNLLFILFIGINYHLCFSQKKDTKAYMIRTIAFYNLENLFDTVNNPNKNDEASPIMELEGNREEIYLDKLKKLSSVLSEIGTKDYISSPAIIGVAEIENDTVLNDLIHTEPLRKFGYEYVHFDSPDRRGIDVGLLYNPTIFRPIHQKTYELYLHSETGHRIHTRDQLLVSGYLDNELIHLIVNHWPSKRGGTISVSYRKKAALLNLKIIEEIRRKEPNAKIIVMGDFNDDPTAPSFKRILKTSNNPNKLSETALYNPYISLFKKGYNTLGFSDNIHLFDQIYMSQSLINEKDNYESFRFFQAHIYNPKKLITSHGKYKGYPFRSFSNGRYTRGYSDHFPVYIYLIKNSTN